MPRIPCGGVIEVRIEINMMREPKRRGYANPGVDRGSTYLYPTLTEYMDAQMHRMHPDKVGYGRYGTETVKTLEQKIAEMEGAFGAMCTSSGLGALVTAISSTVSAGDHMLVVDSVFGPVRKFCDQILTRFGVTVSYYSPDLGQEIESLIRENTKLIYLESPGSCTFEIQDVPAIVSVAKRHGIVTILDNTWATPICFKPIQFGVNISVYSASKYIGGHSDLVLGIIVTDEQHWKTVREQYLLTGQSASSDEAWLALRGLKTLGLRLKHQGESSVIVANWLAEHPKVRSVFHPALEQSSGHILWKRDYTGCSGTFSFELNVSNELDSHSFINNLKCFGIGGGWGGVESLLIPISLDGLRKRNSSDVNSQGLVFRINIGLQDVNELISDLSAALECV